MAGVRLGCDANGNNLMRTSFKQTLSMPSTHMHLGVCVRVCVCVCVCLCLCVCVCVLDIESVFV